MSATNSTTNYALPIFIGTDKPAWLVDWNGAMTDIDAAIKGVDTDVQGAITSISGLSSTVASHTSSISTITGQITVITTNLNTATGNINTINSLIGNGTPTTTDQTIIGAINELNAGKADNGDVTAVDAKIGALANLTTTDKSSVVNAINEVNGKKYTVIAEATPDGVKTVSQIYDELFAQLSALNLDKLVPLKLVYEDNAGSTIYNVTNHVPSSITFSIAKGDASKVYTHTAMLKASSSTLIVAQVTSGGGFASTDESSAVWQLGAKVYVII